MVEIEVVRKQAGFKGLGRLVVSSCVLCALCIVHSLARHNSQHSTGFFGFHVMNGERVIRDKNSCPPLSGAIVISVQYSDRATMMSNGWSKWLRFIRTNNIKCMTLSSLQNEHLTRTSQIARTVVRTRARTWKDCEVSYIPKRRLDGVLVDKFPFHTRIRNPIMFSLQAK